MSIKNFIGLVIKSIAILLACTVAGVLLMCLIFLLPVDKIREHAAMSAILITQEKDYFSITGSINNPGSLQDNYTDAIYINEALVPGPEYGIFNAALGGMVYGEGNYKPSEFLFSTVMKNDYSNAPHFVHRFWNGYELFVKPLMIFTDYGGIRLFNMTLLPVLLGFVCYLMKKRGLSEYVIPLLISFLAIEPYVAVLNMSLVGFIYTAFAAVIIILLFHEKLLVGNRYFIFFELTGIATIFFNMNYFQLIIFAVPLIFLMLLDKKDSYKENIKRAAWLFIGWFAGYAGMMVMKWIVYALLVSPEIFTEIFENIALRTSTSGTTYGDVTRVEAAIMNLSVVFYNIPWLILEAGFIIYRIRMAIKNCGKPVIKAADVYMLLTFFVLVFVRFLIFANHVSIHYWTTYRIVLIPILFFNILLVNTGKKDAA